MTGEPAACRTCLPIGSSPGQSRFAILCVTTATFGEPSRSASVNPLPRRMGSPIASKYSGPTKSCPTHGLAELSPSDCPAAMSLVMKTLDPRNGGTATGDVFSTPGMARNPVTIWSWN